MTRLLKFYLRKKENKMTREHHLREIINYEDSEKRTEKSKYFTEEFFEKCGITKYRDLLEEYEYISFNYDTYIQVGEEKDVNKDLYLIEFYLSNEIVEKEFNILMESDEYSHSLKENSETTEVDYYLTDNFVSLLDGVFERHLFISKDTKEVWFLYFMEEEDRWEWKKLADTFDDFIDRIYIVPPVEDEEFNEKVKKWYDKAFEVLSKKEGK